MGVGAPLAEREMDSHLTQCGQAEAYTCMPSFISIRPTVWPQYTNVTDRTDRQTAQTGQTTDR